MYDAYLISISQNVLNVNKKDAVTLRSFVGMSMIGDSDSKKYKETIL